MMRAPKSLILVAPALALALALGASTAGDYGLTVDDSVGGDCRFAHKHTRNVCNSTAVIHDLRRRYVDGREMVYSAVNVGFLHCSIWFASDAEKVAVYGELAQILAAPKVHGEDRLLHDVGCFPFNSMKRALETELADPDHLPDARQRLLEAHAMLEERIRAAQNPG